MDVSVRIQQDAKRRRRQSSSTTLTPVLDEIKPTRAIVRDMNRSRLMDFNFTIISLFFFLKVEFLKEGCGQDKECESNLKMNYLFGYRSTTEDDFTELEQ